ncbi:MAG TPA: DUF3472 domain-containing protein, partial [Humisphaera sp.]|nr:DUF3472 domain-containing protein [Humisphaera sp.]
MRFYRLTAALFGLSLLNCAALAQEIKIPAFTAYLDPDVNAARIGTDGIVGWQTSDSIVWGGILGQGEVKGAVILRLPTGATSILKLSMAGQSKEMTVAGADGSITVDFGTCAVTATGYQRIVLTGVSKTGKTFGDIQELLLSGPAAKDAFFNLKPRRNAASVHLHYPVDKGLEVVWFYNELTPRADPVATYYEACGFARGYFGIQINSKTERRVIFSVWDAGHEAVDRKKVADDDRVKLLEKGDGVIATDFGNEGTGGHSHLVYPWKTGETQRFLVTAKVDSNATVYTAYFYFNDTKKWGLISSFRAPHDGKLLRGLYSFNEDFGGANGHLRRL